MKKLIILTAISLLLPVQLNAAEEVWFTDETFDQYDLNKDDVIEEHEFTSSRKNMDDFKTKEDFVAYSKEYAYHQSVLRTSDINKDEKIERKEFHKITLTDLDSFLNGEKPKYFKEEKSETKPLKPVQFKLKEKAE